MMRASEIVSQIAHDVRFALRQLRKAPVFTVTAIVTLALGLCASLAIFAFVDAALLKPLPYPSPSRLVGVFESVPMFPQSNLSYLDYLDWKKMNTVFESLSAYQGAGITLTTANGAERAPGARVSDDFFRTLGVKPILGRDFLPGEDLPSAPRNIILSYGAWQTRYGGKPDVLGTTLTLNDDPHVIVGVLPQDFHFGPVEPADFWITLHASSGCVLRRSCHNLYGVARLKDRVSVEAADAAMKTIARQLEQQYPDSNRGQGASIAALSDGIVGNIRPLLRVLLAGATLLMLIATMNVAGLLLVRSEGRRREIAVRRALGASAARVVRQFVTEGVVLVAAGSALGLGLAFWVAKLLIGLIPSGLLARMPFFHELGLNGRVLAFAGVLAVVAALLFAVTPLMHLLLAKSQGLNDTSRGTAGTAWRRIGSKLVVLELATAMVLLVGAGLLGKSLQRLLNVEIGMRAENLATLTIAAPGAYAKDEQQLELARQIESRVAALPGVKAVGLVSTPPLRGGNTVWIRVMGRPYNGEHNEICYRAATPGYFAALEARLSRGRGFTDADDANHPRAAIINQAMVRQYFQGEDPIGKQLSYAPTSTTPPMEIIGIVEDIKEAALDAATPPTMYLPFAQEPTSGFTLAARTSQAEQTIFPALTAAVHEIDPTISTFFGRSMRQIVNESQAAYLRRSSASLVGGFAAAAWLLGVVGLYGVVAYSVGQRTREIGVRMALGAQRHSVYQLIFREAWHLTAFGVAAGAICAIGAATFMRGLLFGVDPWDITTLAMVSIALAVSALLASYVPARRAASVNPVEALRAE